MDVPARLLLGAVGLLAFALVTLDDARLLRDRLGVPAPWLFVATDATVVAGLIHLALTPDHWDENAAYGAFFLVAGVVQLVLASLLTRPGVGLGLAAVATVTNLALVATYVVTRLVPPFGADLPEPLDWLGLVTVGAETVAAAVGFVVARRLADAARLTARP
jgi:hypothetical protein